MRVQTIIMFKKTLNILFALLIFSCAQSQEMTKMLEIKPNDSFSLKGYLYHFEDKTNQLNDQTIQQKNFELLKAEKVNAGISSSNHWVKFKIKNTDNQAFTYFIEVVNPRINHLDIYEFRANSLTKNIHTGDALKFESRGFPNRNFVCQLSLKPNEEAIYYIMAEKRYEVLTYSIQLWQADKFEENDRKSYLNWGILFGLILIVLLLNAVVWFATKDIVYGWFMMIILTGAFHIGAATGLSFQYLWPNFPDINACYPQTFSSWLVVLFQLYFMQQFIGQTAQNSRIFHFVKKIQSFIIGSLVVSIIVLVLGIIPQYFFGIMLLLSLFFDFIVIPLGIISVIERIKKREKIILFLAAVTLFKSLILLIYLVNVALKLFEFDSLSVVLYNFLFDLIILSLGVLYFGFSKFRTQNEELLTTLHQHEQAQSQKIIEALEIERNRIAEDLYDDVGAILSTAIGYISSIMRKAEVKEKYPIISEARKLLERAVENLRNVSHNLMPKNFAQLGLSKSLAETIDKVSETSDIHFEYVVVGKEKRLSSAVEIQIFRIASELINDILKNSFATNATLQLIYDEEKLTLISEDDGSGKPMYNNLESKVNFINGTLNVDVNDGGVTVIVEIPY